MLWNMNLALRLLLGVSVLAVAAGCDNAANGDNTGGGGLVAVGGGTGGSTAGTSSTGGGVLPTGGTGAMLPPGVPLTPADGWVDGMSNMIGVQGAMFEYADDTSGMGLVSDFTGANACIKGTAAKVDLKCTPVAPATDCYGTFWGAAIGLNLNQPTVDMGGMMVGGTAMPYDASALKGFAFEITGGPTGSMIPTTLRFKVEDASGEYCTPPAKPEKLGPNTFMFGDLMTQCWKAGGVSAEGAKSGLLKIAWQVVTVDKQTTPFDFCVANVRALQ